MGRAEVASMLLRGRIQKETSVFFEGVECGWIRNIKVSDLMGVRTVCIGVDTKVSEFSVRMFMAKVLFLMLVCKEEGMKM